MYHSRQSEKLRVVLVASGEGVLSALRLALEEKVPLADAVVGGAPAIKLFDALGDMVVVPRALGMADVVPSAENVDSA